MSVKETLADVIGRAKERASALVAKFKRNPVPIETEAGSEKVKREGALSRVVNKTADVARASVITVAFVLGLAVAGAGGAAGALYWQGHTRAASFKLGAAAGYTKGRYEARQECREAAARAEAEAARADALAARNVAVLNKRHATENAARADAAERRVRDLEDRKPQTRVVTRTVVRPGQPAQCPPVRVESGRLSRDDARLLNSRPR